MEAFFQPINLVLFASALLLLFYRPSLDRKPRWSNQRKMEQKSCVSSSECDLSPVEQNVSSQRMECSDQHQIDPITE